jgi:hypothetical protein
LVKGNELQQLMSIRGIPCSKCLRIDCDSRFSIFQILGENFFKLMKKLRLRGN